MHERSDDTANDCQKQVTRQALSEARGLKVDKFPFRFIFCNTCQLTIFVYYVTIHKESAVMVSDRLIVVHNIEGELGRIYPRLF